MIRIEIPAENHTLAAAIGAALVAYGTGEAAEHLSVTTNSETKPEPKVLTTADVAKSIQAENEAHIAKTVDTKKTSADTATGQDSSTATRTSENASANNVVKLNSAGAASGSTLSSVEQTQTQEQSNVTQTVGVDGANAVTGANGQPEGNDLANVDEKGVGKNAAFCGNAAIPFNATGKKKGQWKKRQGVAEDVYLTWYAESLAAGGTVVVTDEGGEKDQIDTDNAFNASGQQAGEPQVDTAGAFSQQQTGQVNGQVVNNGQSQQKEVAGATTFANAGEYMKWQAEQQAAGNITSGDIDSGYAQTQVGIQDLFNPQTAANAVAVMYQYLAPIAAGQ